MSALLKKIFPLGDLKSTIVRFPLPAACSAALFAVFLLAIHEVLKIEDETVGKIYALLSGGFFWSGIARIVAESRGWNAAKHWLLSLGGIAAMAAVVFSSPQWAMHMLFLSPAFLLLIMVAPYTKGGDDLSFWFFNRVTWFGAAMGVLASLIWAGGLSAALASIDYLFGVNVDDKIYADIWAFSCSVFGPLYALTWVPGKFHFTEEECNDPPGLAFILNWVFAPLVMIYMLILYAYLAKILIAGEMPRGQLAYMITGFGGVGVATYLMGWPLREKGGALLRAVHRYFFPALIIPVIMQALAAGMRIQQYGITEERYAIALTVLWFAIIAILFAHKKFPLKIIPGTLAVLFILAAAGPWGGVHVSGLSQYNRLQALLVKNNILKDGQVVKTEQEVPFEDRKSISSILDYMQMSKRSEWIKPWFAAGEAENVPAMTKAMGFEYVSGWTPEMQEGHFNFYTANTDDITDIGGFDYQTGAVYIYVADGKEWSRTWAADADKKRPEIKATFINDGLLRIEVTDAGSVEFDVAKYGSEEYRRDPSPTLRNLSLEAQSGKLKARIVFQSFGGSIEGDVTKINNLSFTLLVGTAQ